jgi:hypothetical protein
MKLEIPVLGLLCGLLLASCSSSKLPEITDPEALRKNCTVLYHQFPSEIKTNSLGREYVISQGFVSKEKWTPSISALKPIQVLKDKYGIRIYIYFSKETFRGYYVFSDQTAPTPTKPVSGWKADNAGNRPILKNTEMSGIYEFEEPMTSLKD